MADEAPLLEKKPLASIDETIETCIGSTGFYQLLQASISLLLIIYCSIEMRRKGS